MSTRSQLRIVPKTSAYTVNTNQDRCGTRFTNRGATGSVTFTLPAPHAGLIGWFYEFFGVADQNIVVSAGSAKGLAFNNATCASLASQTGGGLIGAKIRATCDGTSWLLEGTTVGVTYTVA
jgi:hypothetical protein